MEYSIRELSELAGVSARTLRYYDELGLLKPLYVSESGYRYYGEKEVTMMYVADERFKAYYDRRIEGCAEFLHQAVDHWADKLAE